MSFTHGTVVHNKGWYEYARLNPRGRLVPSGLKEGHNNPRAYGLKKEILPSAAHRAASSKGSSGAQRVAPSGSIRNLVGKHELMAFSITVDF